MWDEIKAKIAALSALDKTRQVFGARKHRYQFGPRLAENEMSQWEAQAAGHLPKGLRSYYLECGNGGAGPFYGMVPVEDITIFKPSEPYLDNRQLGQRAREEFNSDDEDCEYFYESETSWAVMEDDYQGLVRALEHGCDTQACVITNGPKAGYVAYKTLENGLIEGRSLEAEFHHWLDQEIANFRNVIDLMDTCQSAAELSEACIEKHGFYRARDYMVSNLGINKPAALFGEAENRFHGAVQFPWYEKQFPKKKRFWLF